VKACEKPREEVIERQTENEVEVKASMKVLRDVCGPKRRIRSPPMQIDTLA